ncbi:hypothetical protein SAMN05444166_7550 [Singulisphaera sp. GP187]|uniref:hypothetical protein n=1 Tax=Singulisphaera sp. GP187 TaxID=1882752 RepID=UPI00092794AA|nr:hypothetical protein [Singulisphaera sp. GP187]SIO65046.1 hypothetical protein SAMN05444166_7550 [Singulisphaera sp. GP187]
MTGRRCPLCKSPLGTAEVKPYERLTCGKCHADLHLGEGGKLVVGKPPDMEERYRELKQEVRQLAGQFPLQKVGAGLALLLTLVLGLYYLFGAAERLERVAEAAAQALAGDDPAALASLAASGTTDDLRRWYDAVHPRLVQLRAQWGAKAETVEVHVGQEDPVQQKGSVGISINPASTGARDVSLADPSKATAGAAMPFGELTDWTLTRWGGWKLDGRATYARIAPTTGTP